MWTRQLGALLLKDLQLHGAATALAIGGLVLVTMSTGNAFPERLAAFHVVFVFNLNFIMAPLLWGDWLISRERSKQTFAWLRTMPVDDRVLAGSKFIAAAAAGILCWCLTSALIAPECRPSPDTWLALQCVLLLCGAISVSATWRLSPKLGQIAQLALVILPSLLLGVVTTRAAWSVAALKPWNGWFAAGLLMVYAATVVGTMRWVSRAETNQLIT